eukprot:g5128.t1
MHSMVEQILAQGSLTLSRSFLDALTAQCTSANNQDTLKMIQVHENSLGIDLHRQARLISGYGKDWFVRMGWPLSISTSWPGGQLGSGSGGLPEGEELVDSAQFPGLQLLVGRADRVQGLPTGLGLLRGDAKDAWLWHAVERGL